MKIASVFGTRPEWVKLSPLMPLLDQSFEHRMVYTGQHYSPELDRFIQRDLGLRHPDHRLSPGTGNFTEQFPRMLQGLDRLFRKMKPHLIVVLGDTNSAFAGALVGARLGIPVAHVEAGCRSGNLYAPEEQNRRMIDGISTLLFAADEDALMHLQREGHQNASLVGSTGIDAVLRSSRFCQDSALTRYNVSSEGFALATLHRMENTESRQVLQKRLQPITFAARKGRVLLAAHPRTLAALRRFSLKLPSNLVVTGALGYLEFLSLLRHCRFVLSDSGGIQEEAATLGRPCLVLRGETEWTRLIKAKKNFLIPELGASERKLILRLWEDDAFLAQIRLRPAPGLRAGAAGRIFKSIKSWSRRA